MWGVDWWKGDGYFYNKKQNSLKSLPWLWENGTAQVHAFNFFSLQNTVPGSIWAWDVSQFGAPNCGWAGLGVVWSAPSLPSWCILIPLSVFEIFYNRLSPKSTASRRTLIFLKRPLSCCLYSGKKIKQHFAWGKSMGFGVWPLTVSKGRMLNSALFPCSRPAWVRMLTCFIMPLSCFI